MSAAGDGRVYCRHHEVERQAPEVLDFGLLDARGRAIGYRVVRITSETVESSGGFDGVGWGGYVCKPEDLGVWFVAYAHATRNGESFGASTSDLRARTRPELEVLIAARVAAARARYAKKAGGS